MKKHEVGTLIYLFSKVSYLFIYNNVLISYFKVEAWLLKLFLKLEDDIYFLWKSVSI